jgi:hypothetical protein
VPRSIHEKQKVGALSTIQRHSVGSGCYSKCLGAAKLPPTAAMAAMAAIYLCPSLTTFTELGLWHTLRLCLQTASYPRGHSSSNHCWQFFGHFFVNALLKPLCHLQSLSTTPVPNLDGWHLGADRCSDARFMEVPLNKTSLATCDNSTTSIYIKFKHNNTN